MRELKRILPMLPVLTGKQAHLLLGTDEYIGEGLDEFGELKQV